MAGKFPIRNIYADREEKIDLIAGIQCFFKVASKYQPAPLKFRIISHKAFKFVHLYVSPAIERPDKDHCEKMYPMKGPESHLCFGSGRLRRHWPL